MKICPVEAEVSHVNGQTERQVGREAERWTDMTKLMFAVVNFAKAHKKFS
jgi:hypothetical protein